MGNADFFVCAEDIKDRFAMFIGNKPVLFDPLQHTEFMFKKIHPDLSREESKRRLETQRAQSIQMIKETLRLKI